MREETRSRGVRAGTLITLLSAFLAVTLPSSTALYESVYPTIESSITNNIKSALATAALRIRWSAKPLVQYEPVKFSATIIYDVTPPSNLPTVKVAYANDATLRPEHRRDFAVSSLTGEHRTLDQGIPRRGGGYALTWSWQVVPLSTGPRTLFLDIDPYVVVNGRLLTGLARINQTIRIKVAVNKRKVQFDHVVAAASHLTTRLPDEMTADKTSDVSASLPVPANSTVSAEIDLSRGPDSIDATITPVSQITRQGRTNGAWKVTPTEHGSVDLVFTVHVRGHAGQKSLDRAVTVSRSVTAKKPRESIWDFFGKPVGFFTSLAGLIAAVIGAWKVVQSWRSRAPSAPHDD
jgi:hypothetical protein